MPDDGLGDALARTEPPRDRWGRVLLPDENGKTRAYTRATTLAKALSGDKPGLTAWKLRLAVHGVVGNRTLHNLVAVTPLTEKATLNDIVERALAYAGADEGRTKGTTLHSACARARAVPGSFDALPADLKADVTAYAKCLTSAGVELDVELIERMVVNDAVCSAGSFDDVVTVRGLEGRYVFDLKTGQDLSYEDAQAEIEIQLAIYANANAMVPKAWSGGRGRAQLEPMPEVSKRWAIVAHLPAGSATCTLHWVDIERGWRRARLAFEARKKGTGFVAWGLGPGCDPGVKAATEVVALSLAGKNVPDEVFDDALAILDGAHVRQLPAVGATPAGPPKRKRRTKAEMDAARRESDHAQVLARGAAADADRAEAARLLASHGPVKIMGLPGGDVPAVDPELVTGSTTALTFATVPVASLGDATGGLAVAVVPGVYEIRGPLPRPAVDPELDAVNDRFARDLTAVTGGDVLVTSGPSDGTFHPDDTFTPTAAVLEPGFPSMRAAELRERADAVREHIAAGRIDTSDAALDASLAARDLRVRDEILAERKRVRIDGEIRAAIEDACRSGTPAAQAQKHLALAWDLWSSDWTDAHTKYGTERLAAL